MGDMGRMRVSIFFGTLLELEVHHSYAIILEQNFIVLGIEL